MISVNMIFNHRFLLLSRMRMPHQTDQIHPIYTYDKIIYKKATMHVDMLHFGLAIQPFNRVPKPGNNMFNISITRGQGDAIGCICSINFSHKTMF